MSTGAFLWASMVFAFVVIIAVAMIRTKSRQRNIRRALGLPLRMGTSSAEAKARQAVRVFAQTDLRLTTTARRLSKDERRRMATEIVKEKGLLPKVRRDKAEK